MNRAVRRMALIADERNRSIRLTVREGEIEVTAQSSEQGEGSEIVQADYKGEELQLGFNHQYLLEFLQNVGSAEMIAAEAVSAESAPDAAAGESNGAATAPAKEGRTPVKIAFEFKDPNAQTQMSIAGETTYDYKYIVMPLRI